MPDLHSSSPPARGQGAAAHAVAPGKEDNTYEFALGCECADPALQIERWCQETAETATAHGDAY